MDTKATKFRPILFSTPMVQAILEGRKTKTRRTKGLEKINSTELTWLLDKNLIPENFVFREKNTSYGNEIISPYEVGDVLWVRETFFQCTAEELKGFFYYKASTDEGWKLKWKPSLFMPKQACRIFLKIKSIRAERLQDITEEEAIAEGATQYEEETDWLTAKYGFQMIWETINGKDSWNKNPFVWVYEFEQIEKPLDFII